MAEDHFIVIGNGPAGHQAALTLRDKAPQARITLISRDPDAGYLPHRLPDLIAGRIREEEIFFSPPAAYGPLGIKFRRGQPVAALDPDRRQVVLAHREVLTCSGLVIAVGGRPHVPEPLLGFRDHLTTLKTLQDARVWIRDLARVDTVLLIGGDLTSFALAGALLHLNKKVFFLLDRRSFWPLRPDPAVFEEAAERLARRGAEILPRRGIRNIARVAEHACEVELDGMKISAGLVGAFFGLVPDVQTFARCGLRIDRGILVDEHLATGFDGVYATGDCAQIYHPEIRDYWVSIGRQNAEALGRIAALNLLGGREEPDVAPGSLFELEGVKVNTSWWLEF